MKKDWEIKKLGDICEFRRGVTYSKNDEVENSSNAVLRSNNIDLITNRLDLSEIKYISDKIKIDETKKVKRDSLLICTANGSKAHLGKVALIDDDYDFAFGGFMGLLIPSESVYPRFFYYALISENYKKFIKSLSDGANINNLKFQDLSKFEVPVPPLEEQKRIVEILDEKFAQLETIKANAQTNLQSAKELFQTQLTKAFSNTTWEKKRLGDFCESFEYGTSKKSSADGKVPVLRMGNIKNGKLDFTDLVYSNDEDEIKKYLLSKGDVLFNRTNSPEWVGKTAVFEENFPAIFAGYIIRVNYDKKIINPYYLNYWLNSKETMEYGFSVMTSSVHQANISGTKLAEYKIPLPPLPEQKRIVKELDILSEKVKALQNIYEQMLLDCEELKQSFLCKAFAGEL